MALYRAFVLGESESGHRLPDAARQVVYADPEFYEAFTEVDRMRSEAKIIDAEEGVLGADLSTELRQTIMGITEQRMTYLGVIIQNILQRKVVDEIEYFESKRQDLEDDCKRSLSRRKRRFRLSLKVRTLPPKRRNSKLPACSSVLSIFGGLSKAHFGLMK